MAPGPPRGVAPAEGVGSGNPVHPFAVTVEAAVPVGPPGIFPDYPQLFKEDDTSLSAWPSLSEDQTDTNLGLTCRMLLYRTGME
jgi:hypothetical protein